jgi:hypothetical protein
MTIDELIDLAAEAREELGGDAQVRIAYQPGYPIRAALRYVTIPPGAGLDDLYAQDETAAGQENEGAFPVAGHRRPPRRREPRLGLERRLLHVRKEQAR